MGESFQEENRSNTNWEQLLNESDSIQVKQGNLDAIDFSELGMEGVEFAPSFQLENQSAASSIAPSNYSKKDTSRSTIHNETNSAINVNQSHQTSNTQNDSSYYTYQNEDNNQNDYYYTYQNNNDYINNDDANISNHNSMNQSLESFQEMTKALQDKNQNQSKEINEKSEQISRLESYVALCESKLEKYDPSIALPLAQEDDKSHSQNQSQNQNNKSYTKSKGQDSDFYAENERLKNEKDALLEYVQDSVDETAKLKRQSQETEKTLERLQNENKELREMMEQAKTRSNDMASERDEFITKYRETKESLENNQEELEQTKSQLKEKTLELEELSAIQEDLLSAISEAKQEASDLRNSQLSESEYQEKIRKENKRLEMLVDSLDKERKKFMSKIRHSNKEMKNLTESKDKIISEKNSEIENLKYELQKSRAENAELQLNINEKEKKSSASEEKLKQFDEQLKQIERERNTTSSELEQSKKGFQELREENNNLLIDRDDLSKKLSEKEEYIYSMENTIDSQKEEISSLKTSIEEIKETNSTEHRSLSATIKILKQDLKQKTTTIYQMRALLQEMKEICRTTSSDYNNNTMNKLQKLISRFEKGLSIGVSEKVWQETDQIRELCDNLRSDIAKKTKQLTELSKRVEGGQENETQLKSRYITNEDLDDDNFDYEDEFEENNYDSLYSPSNCDHQWSASESLTEHNPDWGSDYSGGDELLPGTPLTADQLTSSTLSSSVSDRRARIKEKFKKLRQK